MATFAATITCACPTTGAQRCAGVRYGQRRQSADFGDFDDEDGDVEPCDCPCHDLDVEEDEGDE